MVRIYTAFCNGFTSLVSDCNMLDSEFNLILF